MLGCDNTPLRSSVSSIKTSENELHHDGAFSGRRISHISESNPHLLMHRIPNQQVWCAQTPA